MVHPELINTLAPWVSRAASYPIADTGDFYTDVSVVSLNETVVAYCCDSPGMSHEERLVNGLLMAAAPDMYALLHQALDNLQEFRDAYEPDTEPGPTESAIRLLLEQLAYAMPAGALKVAEVSDPDGLPF